MSKKILYSLKLEQHVVAGILKNPHCYFQIAQFLKSVDFGDPSGVNPALYNIIGNSISNSEPIDAVLISQKTSSLKLSFEDGISVYDYLQSLLMRNVSESACIEAAKSVKKFAIRRGISENADRLKKEMSDLSDDVSFDDIIAMSDKIYNREFDAFFNTTNLPSNIYCDMEQNIEILGENPTDEIGLMTHLPRVNDMYGSILMPGNITVFASRYGGGKSTLAIDITSKAGVANNIPVLHFDNGEMSYEETQIRMCSSMSGVPLYLVRSGRWRQNEEATRKIREVWNKIKNWKFFYYNVGGENYTEMINVARRWYYSEVKRGNQMIWSFDYLKLGSLGSGMEKFWAEMGLMMDQIKTFIQREVVFENKPQISFLTSVQANRLGISQGRNSADVEDTEAVIGLSDMIGQIASHVFILRKKTTDEIIADGVRFGTHKLINVKARHMGKDPNRAFDLVSMPDGSKKKNYINLDFNNFCVTEKGDLIDMADSLDISDVRPRPDGELPL